MIEPASIISETVHVERLNQLQYLAAKLESTMKVMALTINRDHKDIIMICNNCSWIDCRQ